MNCNQKGALHLGGIVLLVLAILILISIWDSGALDLNQALDSEETETGQASSSSVESFEEIRARLRNDFASTESEDAVQNTQKRLEEAEKTIKSLQESLSTLIDREKECRQDIDRINHRIDGLVVTN